MTNSNRLLNILNNTKLQSTNNALYQLIASLIQAIKDSQSTNSTSSDNINIIEVDTSTGPVSVNLNLIGTTKTVIKDITGNAFTNNITINGTVDGVVSPVINTNYGLFRVYSSRLGFRTW